MAGRKTQSNHRGSFVSVKTRTLTSLLFAAAAVSAANSAFAQATFDGFLCCNMRTTGDWISDSNYNDSGQRVVPVGTPTKVTGYGRQRVQVAIDGKRQAIGNDYSRDLGLEAFAKRYVVTEDPKVKLATYPAKLRDAIQAGQISRGMTRDQVLMAVGYPISSENPRLDAPVWRYWVSSFSEFQVQFDDAGRVREVIAVADPALKRVIWAD
jgi:hypothetical protein